MLVVHFVFHVLCSGDPALIVVSSNTFWLKSEYFFCICLSVDGMTTKEKALMLEEVTLMERVMMFGGVGLAVFVFFLATVIAGGIIHHHGWQKGWAAAKHSSLIQHK